MKKKKRVIFEEITRERIYQKVILYIVTRTDL